MKIVDLAQAIAPDAEVVEIGVRPGEKLHEEMIAVADAPRTVRRSDRYVVAPTLAIWGGYQAPVGDPVADDFSYSSDNNDLWLSIDELRDMIANPKL
jgi:UDP-N-acetylglucosamine 4,6-dehydratase